MLRRRLGANFNPPDPEPGARAFPVRSYETSGSYHAGAGDPRPSSATLTERSDDREILVTALAPRAPSTPWNLGRFHRSRAGRFGRGIGRRGLLSIGSSSRAPFRAGSDADGVLRGHFGRPPWRGVYVAAELRVDPAAASVGLNVTQPQLSGIGNSSNVNVRHGAPATWPTLDAATASARRYSSKNSGGRGAARVQGRTARSLPGWPGSRVPARGAGRGTRCRSSGDLDGNGDLEIGFHGVRLRSQLRVST